MARTVVALYEDFASANDTIQDLVNHGFMRENISLIAYDQTGEYSGYLKDRTDIETSGAAEGAGVGAGIGAVLGGLGGLLVGLGALAIPGIGPVLAAGPLAAALTGLAGAGVGAVAGGVTGGLLGALVDMGVPEETANYYAEGVRRGGTLVTLRTPDERANEAVDIMNNHNPIDVNKRSTQWREEGWTTFDPKAEPYVSTRPEEKQLYPSDKYREPEEQAGTEVERTLWTGEGEMNARYHDFSHYDTSFRNHYQTTMAGTGYTYDQYLPAYRYGYDLATDTRYRSSDWMEIEPEARRYWDERNPGTWERFKSAVRHAWEEAKDVVS